MNYCPQCNANYPGNIAVCPTHGVRLQPRASRPVTPSPVRSQHILHVTDPHALDGEEPTETQWSADARAAQARQMAPELSDDPPTQNLATIQDPSPHPEDPQDPDEPDLVGSIVAGRYRIQRRLGEGGMGVVYAALDERIEKPIAIKVLRSDYSKRTDVVARFTQEAKSAARIKHENVLDVTDYGQTEEGGFYIAMELLRGTDLADVLLQYKTLEPARGIEIAVQVCRALSAAHAKGIVHRDLKPENVFIVQSDDGREIVKIVDFGIAQMKDLSGGEGNRKLTRTGMIFGTPEYMSPEQAAGKPIDHRVDIYAVGVILYEMFAGRVPFEGDSFMGILTQHMFEHPLPIGQHNPTGAISPELEAVVFKAMAKDPSQRYASMNELAEDLNRIRSGIRTTAPTPDLTTALPKPPGGSARTTPMSLPGAQVASAITGSSASNPTPQITGVSRTIEAELPTPTRKPMLIVAVIACVVGVAVLAAAAIGGGIGGRAHTPDPTPVARPALDPHAGQPTPTPPTPETLRPPAIVVPPEAVDAAVAVAPPTQAADAAVAAVVVDAAVAQTLTPVVSQRHGHTRPHTPPPQQHNPPPQQTPCGRADPHTGLLIPCFGQ